MCGFSDALNRGHTVKDMTTKGFSLKMDPETGRVAWKVGGEMEKDGEQLGVTADYTFKPEPL